MTKNEAYEYLLQPRRLQRLIWQKTLQRDELQSCLLPAAIRYDKEIVQSAPEDKLLEVAAAVADLDREIRRLQEKRARVLIEISSMINLLPDETEAAVLIAYFIRRKNMSDIAEDLGYSRSHCYYHCRRGVKHLSELPQLNNNNNPDVIN